MGQLGSGLLMKCPRCGKGKLYPNTGILPQKGWFEMLSHCSECGLKYENGNGFFYGAMYVSYMFNIALFVTTTVGYYVFMEKLVDWKLYILAYVLLTFILTKLIFRLSRSFWLMMMVKYDPTKKEIH